MNYVDENFMNSDASPRNKELYLQVQAILQPYIDKWMKDPLADHHALHMEMKRAVYEFLLKQPENQSR